MVNLITDNQFYDAVELKKNEIKLKTIFDFLKWFKAAGDEIQLDIETNVVDRVYEREIYVVQIGDKSIDGDQWVFDIPRVSEEHIIILKQVLSSRKPTWIIHNAAFEYIVIKMKWGIELFQVKDTFLMSKVIFNGKETPLGFHSLSGALLREFNINISKDEQKTFNGEILSIDQITYAATDVLLMGTLADRFEAKAAVSNDMMTINLEAQVVRAFGDIQVNGLMLNWPLWEQNAKDLDKDLQNVVIELNDMLFTEEMYQHCIKKQLIQKRDAYNFRWNSIAFKASILKLVGLDFKPTIPNLKRIYNKFATASLAGKAKDQLQVVGFLYHKKFVTLEEFMIKNYDKELLEAKIKVLKDTVLFDWTQQQRRLAALQIMHPTLTSTSDKSLNRLTSSLVRKYKEWAKKAKLVSSFGLAFKKYIDGDGKVRTQIQQIVATGRVSSKNPNLQNLPHVSKYRNPFIVDDDSYSFVIADYSSQELLIVATLAKEQAWLDAVARGEDLHSANASMIFGQEWHDAAEYNCEFVKNKQKCKCVEHKRMRTHSKTISFGLV